MSGDERYIVRLDHAAGMAAELGENSIAHLGGIAVEIALHHRQDPFSSELLAVVIVRLSNAVGEDQQPVTGQKLDARLKRRQGWEHARRKRQSMEALAHGAAGYFAH